MRRTETRNENLRCPSKSHVDISGDGISSQETKVDMNYPSEHTDNGGFIWKEGEDRDGLDEAQVYNLNRKNYQDDLQLI